jgi:hypothetical protein
MEKSINDLTIIEIKAALFDRQMQIQQISRENEVLFQLLDKKQRELLETPKEPQEVEEASK